jgi:nucleoside 2-deoxyribosyltransferase
LLDEFILWIGKHSAVGQSFSITYPKYRSVFGVWNIQAFNFVTKWINSSHLFESDRSPGMGDVALPLANCYLTSAGWERYRELAESHAASRYGFMAMQFGDERLDQLVANHFVPAVKAAGFDLRRLDEGQPAGLIDDQLRVRIRTARFVVSDITHGNNGTYWEAGYAEGLGRPVIYSCEKSVFDGMDKTKRAHFDTNHLVTVLWEPDKLNEAARRLKDIVRATFPDEAKLED